MRILQLVAGEKWTGAAAVVFAQTRALVEAGLEAQFGFVSESPLAARLAAVGWARPLLTRPRSPLDYLADARRLRETVLRERFDVIHAHLSHDHYLAAAAVRGTGVALARTFHHLQHVRRDPLSRGLSSATDAVAFSNSEIARACGRDGPVASPVVDATAFSPGARPSALLARLGVPSGAFVIGTVGKIATGRGHDLAIEALARAPERACLLHVGKGEDRPALQRRAEALGLADRNFWAGYQEELLPELYRAMDVLLFTASGSDQGQRAILEAMASGVPIVSVDLPGVCDLVRPGEDGFVESDVPGLSAALRRIADSPVVRERLAAAARERALEFEGRRFVARMRPFYEELAARSSA